MLDRAVALHVDGELSGADAARVKLFCTEMQARVVDRCLQLFGGYGYMMEYPIARLYTDARVARIYAGHQRGNEGDHRQVARPVAISARLVALAATSYAEITG